MPSSTSSSNARIPEIRYGRLYGAALLLVCLMALGSELYFRSQQFLPNIVDDARFWSIHRADVYAEGERERFVIVGSSRVQLGVDPDILERQLRDYKIKQLAMSGSPGFDVVRDLCEDPDFSGVILWSSLAQDFMPSEDEARADINNTRYYHEHHWEFEKNLDCLVSAWLQSKFVILAPELSLRFLLERDFLPVASYVNMRFNRFRPARYHLFSGQIVVQENEKMFRGFNYDELTMQDTEPFETFLVDTLEPLHQQLRARGGRLIMLRMPVTGGLKRYLDIITPREQFWDKVAEKTTIPSIYYEDYPGLTGFDCPDTSHLDGSDAPVFTRNLAPILRRTLESDPPKANRDN